MPKGFKAIVLALLSEPAVRDFVEDVFYHLLSDLFLRKSVDPKFKANSDALCAKYLAATTDQERTDAQQALRLLFSSQ